jgi:hypothetical protein
MALITPRFRPNPSNTPASRCTRHFVNVDEYNRSRRKIARFSPTGAASTSSRIRFLKAADHDRRDDPSPLPSNSRFTLMPPSSYPPTLNASLKTGNNQIGTEGPIHLSMGGLLLGWALPGSLPS